MSLSEAIEKVKPSIVQNSFFATGLSPEFQAKIQKPVFSHVLGTGFFINSDGYVVTARHVIEGGNKMAEKIPAANKRILVGLALPNTESMRANFVLLDYERIDEDALHDIILLKLMKNPFKGEVRSPIVINGKELPLLYGTPILNLNRPRDGLPIAVSGYPLNETVLVTNSGGLATCWGTNTRGVADSYLADIEVNAGDSGAPVYEIENSTIIGLCVASKSAQVRDQNDDEVVVNGKIYFYSSGLTIVVPAHYIAELLKKNQIECKYL